MTFGSKESDMPSQLIIAHVSPLSLSRLDRDQAT